MVLNKKQRSEIGQRIKKLRLEIGKTQVEMVKILKVQQSAISKLERGDIMPTVENLLILQRISCRSIDWLLRGD